MKVVLFCGGRGTRIRDYSDSIPKPMIPLGHQPILRHVMQWYSEYGHDEFVLCMDGEVEVHLIKLALPEDHVDPEHEGAVELLDAMPEGRKMGRLVLGRGHQGLLPVGAAYRFHAAEPAVILLQTIAGEVTVQKWAEICQTAT